jgi:hypothetical protein
VKAMKLSEAINHCKEVAKSKCDSCGAEHKQLAEWLIELKKSRKAILEICWEENSNMSHCRNCAIRKFGVCPNNKGDLYGEWERESERGEDGKL